MPSSLDDSETEHVQHELQELRAEHRDLDQIIDHLTAFPPDDQLLIRRLKKRKLALKDRIDKLEGMLVPDIPA